MKWYFCCAFAGFAVSWSSLNVAPALGACMNGCNHADYWFNDIVGGQGMCLEYSSEQAMTGRTTMNIGMRTGQNQMIQRKTCHFSYCDLTCINVGLTWIESTLQDDELLAGDCGEPMDEEEAVCFAVGE